MYVTRPGLRGLGSPGIEGSGPNGDWTRSGPGWPIVTSNGDGTRRVVLNPNVPPILAAPERVLPQLARACGNPAGASMGIFPGVVDCGSSGMLFAMKPGASWQGFRTSEGIDVRPGPGLTQMLGTDPRNWPEGWYALYGPTPTIENTPPGLLTPEQIRELLGPFSGNACFGTAQVGGVWRGDVQGPCPGDPDASINLRNGMPNPFHAARGSGGYATGTPAVPYRPWADPSHPLYGHPVLVEPVAPALPPTHDPWTPPPPRVDPGPGVVPVDDSGTPTGPAGPPAPPPPSESPEDDGAGAPSIDPNLPRGGPVLYPGDGGLPPTLPPGGGGVKPPTTGTPGASSSTSYLAPLAILAALFLTRKR